MEQTECSEMSAYKIQTPGEFLHLPAYENGTECSETSEYKIQTPGNYPEESIQHTEQGESLKSRETYFLRRCLFVNGGCPSWSIFH